MTDTRFISYLMRIMKKPLGVLTPLVSLSPFSVKNKFNYAYSQEFPYRTNHILECEFYLLEHLDCCLIVYQPYRPLLTLVQDVGPDDQLLTLAWRIVNDSLRTDVCLLYPPYQIAIGKPLIIVSLLFLSLSFS